MTHVQPFDLKLLVNDEEIAISYLFDLDLFSIKIMYSSLSQGRLYEPELCHVLFRALKKGDTYLDVGAHVGYFAIIAAKLVGPEGRVVAFEPEGANLARLGEHIAMNKLANVTVVNKVVCDAVGPRTFYINRDNDGGHGLWDVGRHSFNVKSAAQPQPIEIEATTLDATAAALGTAAIKVLKIDTEGGEHQILEGAAKTIERQAIPFVICELNEFGLNQLGSSQSALRSYMKARGYDTFVMDKEGAFPKLVPEGVTLVSRSNSVTNVLFSRPEWLAPYWPMEAVD